ncbi:MAG: SdrD B-like domain-containing protein, partial [Planctomycetota bacterium]
VTVTDANGCTDDDTETLFNPGCIGDRIWLDVDKDGCQDANLAEFGFAGVTLMLTGTTSTGASVNMTTVTDQVGQYLFSPLAPGTYQVKITLPNNFTLSPANSSTCGDIFSSSDFLDSDFNANGSTSNIVLAEGQCNLTIDGGLYDICINISTPGVICCDQTLCGPGVDPAPITSTTPASGGSGTVQYMWMYSHVPGPFNNATWFPIVDVNGVPIATGPSYDPGPLYQTTFFIRCAKSSTCEDWLESNIVTITVDDIAVANISGTDLVCVGDPASYSSAGSNPPNATYLWNFGNWATPQTSTQPNVTVTWSTAGVVYISLSVTVGSCTSTDVLGVAISDSPVICGNALVINTTNMGAAVMVEWNIPHTPGEFDFVVQRSKDGVHFEDIGTVAQAEASGTHQYAYADHSPKHGNSFYRLDVRSNNAHLIYSNVERVAMFSSVESFVVRPNPVTDHITIECNKDVKTAVKMEVLSLQGKLVSSQKLDEGMVSQPVDLSHLSGGVYLLQRGSGGRPDLGHAPGLH